ncbi:hypothetical protein BDY21DRAFT_353920 [Lineolata rhizophorae]|uniref:Uncharacterized protein n=1 Tax=Lineolata rhizophorae TaxID=578093 RepID=A0A6A6NRJ7_9PEZI|nr:hypothetical protein BDY21DRAFT_353920 [Lineolata rhizophorae]
MAGWPYYRENNVPKWQRIHQTHDGLRQWEKGPRGKMLTVPFFALFWTGLIGSTYMMGRMVFGHKTLFGKG